MITKVVLAKLSPTMEEGTIVRWSKAEGDAVKVGDVLAEIETDKANMEMEALGAGVLRKVDETGRTAHPGDFEGQVDRMLSNVAALLEGQGASFADVVSAITYLKRPVDAARLRAKLHDAGYEGFPNALVVAPVCRPELLCETEALAVLPRDASRARGAQPGSKIDGARPTGTASG